MSNIARIEPSKSRVNSWHYCLAFVICNLIISYVEFVKNARSKKNYRTNFVDLKERERDISHMLFINQNNDNFVAAREETDGVD